MQLLVFGAPGVGKGTQAKIFSQKWNIPHISTGDILRAAVKNKTETGLKAAEIMARGELVPDEVMIAIIRDALKNIPFQEGFLLDGFPRTVNQAVALDKLFAELEIKNVTLLSFEADEEELVQRLTHRKTCRVCNNIFNTAEIEGMTACPDCGASNSFFQRNDDTEDVIRKRFVVFMTTTRPILEFYQKSKKIIRINAFQSIEKVTEEILSALHAE